MTGRIRIYVQNLDEAVRGYNISADDLHGALASNLGEIDLVFATRDRPQLHAKGIHELLDGHASELPAAAATEKGQGAAARHADRMPATGRVRIALLAKSDYQNSCPRAS